jgi:hypothetical protein
MHPLKLFRQLPKPLALLLAAYFLTSLGHFAHNAEFLCEYPSLPTWLTRVKVYAAWLAITAVRLTGLVLIKNKLVTTGLLLVAIYAALGFDGLGHYAVAPMAHHTLGGECHYSVGSGCGGVAVAGGGVFADESTLISAIIQMINCSNTALILLSRII